MGYDSLIAPFEIAVVHIRVPCQPRLDARVFRRWLPLEPGLLRVRVLLLLLEPLLPRLIDGAVF